MSDKECNGISIEDALRVTIKFLHEAQEKITTLEQEKAKFTEEILLDMLYEIYGPNLPKHTAVYWKEKLFGTETGG